MERTLGLMAGAGILPGRAAAEARRQGWRVVAFAFEDAPGLAEAADVFIPSTITDIQAVLAGLAAQRAQAAVFVGKFWKSSAFSKYDQADAAGRGLAQGGLSDAALAQMVVATLAGMSIEVLDQRRVPRPVAPARGHARRARARPPPSGTRSARAFAWRAGSPPTASARRWCGPAA